eukprot:tig00020629_g12458.t1
MPAFVASVPSVAGAVRVAPSTASSSSSASAPAPRAAAVRASSFRKVERVQFSTSSRFCGRRISPKFASIAVADFAAFRISAGWGPEPVWQTAKVTKNEVAAEDHHAITVEVTVPAAAQEAHGTFRLPGQYVQIKTSADGKPGFFAIASPPFFMSELEANDDQSVTFPLEFLIKRADGAAGELCDLKPGAEVSVSQFLGKGYDITATLPVNTCETIIFVATGSGIAPIRSCIEADAPDVLDVPGGFEIPFRKDVRLYYGVQTPARMAYKDRFAAWEDIGVKVTPVVSRPDGTGWSGATGYVQEAMKKDGVKDASSAVIVMCGVKGMSEAVKELAAEWGVPAEKVLTNF